MSTKIKIITTILMPLLLGGHSAWAAAPFVPNDQPVGWVARPNFNTFNIAAGNAIQYRSKYVTSSWSGDVIALDISSTAQIGPTGPWGGNSAAAEVNTQNFDTGRKIVTVKDDGTKIPFRYADLGATQQDAIGTATTAPNILNYVRGDRSNEAPSGSNYRARSSVMADLVHSTLAYWPYGTDARLFVGGNGGMLHVLNVSDGSEDFAFVPSTVIPNLKDLVASPYGHRYFVDGGLTVATGILGSSTVVLLAGGLGAGGQGLYCLDVTSVSPANEAAAASKIKWEVSSADAGFSNLGYTYGSPRIARLNNNTVAVIAGNGYMNGGNGQASLFIIDADTGALITEISTGAGTLASPNGLSAPALVDTNNDGKVDYAYAGDIDGTMWKFDLSGGTPSAYSASSVYTTSPAQAITTAPVVATGPNSVGRMVLFGTGRMLTTADAGDTAVHYVYGIWDGAPSPNAGLVTHSLTETLFGGSIKVRYLDTTAPDYSNADTSLRNRGWKLALPAGERVVGENPLLNDSRFTFTSMNPTVVNAQLPNGNNWQNQIPYLTGAQSATPIYDLNVDGLFDSSDFTSGQVTNSKYFIDGIASQPVVVDSTQYTYTLFNANTDTTVPPPSSSSSSSSSSGGPVDPGPGVSGGHFDIDIFYGAETTTTSPTSTCQTKAVSTCYKEDNVKTEWGEVSPTYCTTSNGFDSGYTYMNSYVKGSSTGCKKSNKFEFTCCTSTSTTGLGGIARKVHVHEYDDVYDVTGINMLNASLNTLNLSKATAVTPTTQFKVLIANQYLNPAVKVNIGPAGTWASVKDYGDQTVATTAADMIALQPAYTRNDIGNLIYNLPLDAFLSKDWWGDGQPGRSGLMPTKYSCVWSIDEQGNPISYSKDGPNGETRDGALTFTIISADTPASAIEMNYPAGGAKYGWRVKRGADFKQYVYAEYATYWHHPNGFCYGDASWVQNPPEDPLSDAAPLTPAVGSADPKDGTFAVMPADTSSGGGASTSTSGGGTSTSTSTSSGGGTSTSTSTSSGGTGGTSTSTSTSSGGLGGSSTSTSSGGGVACVDYTDPTCWGSEHPPGTKGRVNWREIVQ